MIQNTFTRVCKYKLDRWTITDTASSIEQSDENEVRNTRNINLERSSRDGMSQGHVSVNLGFKDMLDFDESKILNKIHIPCLLIEGEKDFKTPKDVALNMHKKLKKSELYFIKNATHDTNIQNTKKINKIIEKFMADL